MEPHDFFPEHPLDTQTSNYNQTLPPAPTLNEECESMASSNSNSVEAKPAPPKPEPSQSNSYPTDTSQDYYPVVYPTYVSPFYPYPVPYWTNSDPMPAEPAKDAHEVVKPTAVHSKNPINVDELVGMSKWSLGENIGSGEPSSLSLKLFEGSSRQSAFHANPAPSSSDMNSGGSPIHVV